KPYGNEMMKVCGAGKTKADLAQDACLTTFVNYYGRKAFRRPLAQSEVDDFKAYYRGIGGGADPLTLLVGRLLAHPNFYYRFDTEGAPLGGTEGQDGVYRLSKWELLSKVTFPFWAAPPNDGLYDKVATVDITQDADLKAMVDQVLADPKATQGV